MRADKVLSGFDEPTYNTERLRSRAVESHRVPVCLMSKSGSDDTVEYSSCYM